MSLRVDTSPLIAASLIIGDTGLGVLAENIPSTGEGGAGYLYNDLDLPTDNGKEVRGEIVTYPSQGTLVTYEDSSFVFSGAPDGIYTFQYQLYVDGVAVNGPGPATVTLTVGVQDSQLVSGSYSLGLSALKLGPYPTQDEYQTVTTGDIAAGRDLNEAHVFIMAGQSNSSGRALIADVPADTNPVSGVSTWKRTTHTTGSGQWENLSHSNNQYDLQGKFGAELQLMKNASGDYYTGSSNNVFLIKLADGGTSLHTDWAPLSALRMSLFYDHIKLALRDLQSRFSRVRVYGFYWDQGEADSIVEADSLNYEDNLRDFLTEFRVNIGIPDLPIVLRRMNIAIVGVRPYVANVISAQDAVAASDSNTQLTDETWTDVGDNLHGDGAFQNNQGNVVFNLLKTIGGKIYQE